MNMHWFRWYHGTAYDPKWRVIAIKAQVGIPLVVAVWAAILEHASTSPDRGIVHNWCHEDEAAALAVEEAQVVAVWDAMQGKVLQGDQVINWPRRQPKREDETSAERVQKHREQQRNKTKRTVTQSNEVKHNVATEEIRGEESRVDNKKQKTLVSADAARVDEDFAEVWAIYPKREGGNSRHDALKAYRARRRTGVEHKTMLEGTQRYATYCEEKGWIRSAFVKQGAAFYGPSEHYLESWEVGDVPEPRARDNKASVKPRPTRQVVW